MLTDLGKVSRTDITISICVSRMTACFTDTSLTEDIAADKCQVSRADLSVTVRITTDKDNTDIYFLTVCIW